jgi:hypothetical protein
VPGTHRPRRTELTPELRLASRRVITLAFVNGAVGCALIAAPPGTSPALAFLRLAFPLWVWAAGFLAVTFLIAIKQLVAAHTVAAFGWLFLAAGALLGLLNGTTGAPAASLVFAALVLGMASFHASGLVFRRAEQQAQRGR